MVQPSQHVRKRELAVGMGVFALVVAMTAALAIYLGQFDARLRAGLLAEVILNRASKTSEQIAAAGEAMAKYRDDPCSPAAIGEMRQLDIASSLLQGVGHVAGTQLLCASDTGGIPEEVGPPDFISGLGYELRRNRLLSVAPTSPLLLVTAPDGFTVLIHNSLIFDMIDGNESEAYGLVSASTANLLLSTAPGRIDWAAISRQQTAPQGAIVERANLVAWHRSPKWDYIAYAVLPTTAIDDAIAERMALLGPLGTALAAILGLLAWRYATARDSLTVMLRAALRRGELSLVYQPIVDLRSGEWVGVETLLRWTRRSGESISPEIFVPIAEQTGLIKALTAWVIQNSLSEMQDLLRARPGLSLSINLSTQDIEDDEALSHVLRTCDRYGVAPRQVHIEITERDVITPRSHEIIAEFRQRGIQLGIDDFGVGYSNLAYLQDVPMDYLKIDKALTRTLTDAQRVSNLVSHVVALARSAKLEVVAEGVETVEQRRLLIETGVALGQGWLLSRPMPIHQLRAALSAPDANALAA